jgi:hypothetical protein
VQEAQREEEKRLQQLAAIKPKADGLSLVETTGATDKVKNFLNRLLGLEVKDQILVFQMFTNFYEMEVRRVSTTTTCVYRFLSSIQLIMMESICRSTRPSRPAPTTTACSICRASS